MAYHLPNKVHLINESARLRRLKLSYTVIGQELGISAMTAQIFAEKVIPREERDRITNYVRTEGKRAAHAMSRQRKHEREQARAQKHEQTKMAVLKSVTISGDKVILVPKEYGTRSKQTSSVYQDSGFISRPTKKQMMTGGNRSVIRFE